MLWLIRKTANSILRPQLAPAACLQTMAAEKVNQATSNKLKEMDWMKNIEICELVGRDPGQTKDVIKSIKNRLKSKHANAQLFAVMLLEMLMNNCGEQIHKQVIDNGLLPILVKIVKKKNDWPVRERIFLLLDATQTALGGASGKYPQYYSSYYDLVSCGVKFPPRPRVSPSEAPVQKAQARSLSAQESQSKKGENGEKQATTVSDSSIIHKASSVMEVLRDVLNALDPKHPEGAADEFVLDLVEQCSFQKQRIMHLVMTSRDEKVVTQAIGLNEQLHQVLTRHDALLSVHPTITPSLPVNGEEEEDAELLFRRLRKGKALVEDDSEDSVASFRSISEEERMRRPLIRPLPTYPSDPDSKPRPLSIQPIGSDDRRPVISLPPPPAKYTEREKFFQDKNMNGSVMASHVRGLSLHSSNGSSSRSGSTDYSERDAFSFRD